MQVKPFFNIRQSKNFHYTDVESLYHIVSEKCLLASNVKFLNDWKEIALGYEYLRNTLIDNYSNKKVEVNPEISDSFDEESLVEIFASLSDILPKNQRIRKISNGVVKKSNATQKGTLLDYLQDRICSDFYSISFCTNGDNLPNWITYAKESGVCLEFDFSEFMLFDHELMEASNGILSDGARKDELNQVLYHKESTPHEVFYLGSKKKDLDKWVFNMFSEQLQITKRETDSGKIIPDICDCLIRSFDIIPFIKTSEFKNELESRLAFRPKIKNYRSNDDHYKSIRSVVKFRVRNNLIIPYMKIGWESKNNQQIYPIKSITIGPGKNQTAIFESIIEFIENQPKWIIPCDDDLNKGYYKRKNVFITGNGIKISLSKTPYIF